MRERVRIAVLLGLVLLAFGNTLGNGFTFDDHGYILHNPTVTDFSLKGLFKPNRANNVLRPVTFATLAANWKTAGEEPFAYHLVNVLLHAVVTVLLYLLIAKLLETHPEGRTIAWVAAMLFAVHPVHTEAVASIVGRSELLAAGFILAGWLLHLNDRHIAALVCLLLALMSKESAVVFLPLIAAGDYVRNKFKPLPHYGAVAALTLLYLGVFWKLKGGHLGELQIEFIDDPLASLPVSWRILNALRIAWKYVGLQVYPATFSCDYSYNSILLYAGWKHAVLAVAGALLVVGAWAWSGFTGQRAWFLAGAVYFCGFAATANILIPTGTIMAERLAYLPSAGFCLFVVLLWTRLRNYSPLVGTSVLVVVVTVLGIRTAVRNGDWRNDLVLFSKDVKAVPRNAKIHGNLGVQYKSLGQLQAARAEFATALGIYPDFPEVLEVDGIVASQLNKDGEARGQLEKALTLTPRTAVDYGFRAVTLAAELVKLGETTKALELLDEVVSSSPGYARAWSNRAVIRYKRGDAKGARSDAERALQLDPQNSQAQQILAAMGADRERANL